MALRNKRQFEYKDKLSNAESIGKNYTLVPMLFERATEKKVTTKTGTNFQYWIVNGVTMNKEDVFVKRIKGKDEPEPAEGEELPHPGTTLEADKDIVFTCTDKRIATASKGSIIKVAVGAAWYDKEDRYTFKSNKVIVDMSGDHIDLLTYKNLVQGTKLAEIPTKDNINPDDFPEGTDEKYIARSFLLPLSNDTTAFASVDIDLDEKNSNLFFCSDKEGHGKYVGLNIGFGSDRVKNGMNVVYTRNDDVQSKCLMTYNFFPEVWEVFGVRSTVGWTKGGARMIYHAKGWLAYGSSQLKRILNLGGNKEDENQGYGGFGEAEDIDPDVENGDSSFDYSQGFIGKMHLDLRSTIMASAIPLTPEYIGETFNTEDYQPEEEFTDHPLNNGWMMKVKRNDDFILNITDMSKTMIESYFKEVESVTPNNIKYYGVFNVNSDAPYEKPEGPFKYPPVIVFAVNDKSDRHKRQKVE
jgi:hypothetical protein